VNCTEHRKKVEIYAVNFFTDASFLVTLDSGVPFHDAVALEVVSGDFKEKIVLLDLTYRYIQWPRGFSIKGRQCHTTLHNFPRKGRQICFSPFSAIFCIPGEF